MINEFNWMDLIGAFLSGLVLGFIAKCLFHCSRPQYDIDIDNDDDRNHS